MGRRRALLSLLVALPVLLAGCKSQPADEAALGRIKVDRELPTTVRSPADWRALYRLAPDHRFLLALGEIDRLASGSAPRTTSVRFSQGHWAVSYAGRPVGPLPKLPSYAELKALLDHFARGYAGALDQRWHQPLTAAEWKEIDEESHAFLAPDAFKTLRSVDALWHAGHHSPRLLIPAARALVYLALQQRQDAGVGDALPGEALAALTLAQAAARDPMTSEEALLAYALGYTNAARTLAAKLPATEVTRTFLLDHRVADDHGATASHPFLARFLELRLASDRGGFVGWLKKGNLAFGGRPMPPGVLLSGVDAAPLGAREELLVEIPGLIKNGLQNPVLLHLRAAGLGALGSVARFLPLDTAAAWSSGQSVLNRLYPHFPRAVQSVENFFMWGPDDQDFESLVASASGRAKGPFLTASSLSSYFRANYYSAIFLLGSHYVDKLDYLPAAKAFGQWLRSGASGIGAELGQLEALRAAVRSGKVEAKELLGLLRESRRLGSRPLSLLVDSLSKGANWGDPKLLQVPADLAARLDSRLKDRLVLASAGYQAGRDRHLYRVLASSAVAEATWEHAWTAGSLAFEGRDLDKLERLARSDNMSWKHQVEVVSDYAQMPQADPALVRSRFQQLLSEADDSYLAEKKYVEYLEARKDYQDAEASLRHWLGTSKSPGLDRPAMFIELSKVLQKEGKLTESWAALQGEAARSGMEDVFLQASRVRFAQGHIDMAEAIAAQGLARYSHSDASRANLLGLLWRDAKYGLAAKVMGEAPRSGHAYQWNAFAKAFVKAFKGEPDSEALAAFDALNALPLAPGELAAFPKNVGPAGRPALAFQMFAKLKGRGYDRLNELMESYRFLKASEGAAKADAWLTQTVPLRARPAAAMMLYSDGEYDASWSMLPNFPPGRNSDYVWLLRASGYLRSGENDTMKKQELLDYFAQPGGSHYRVVGRYLMGLAPLDDVLKAMTTRKRICELGYYIGVKAMAAGDYRTASDWFHVSALTGSTHDGEYRWSYSILAKWMQEPLSLQAMAKQAAR